MPRCVLLVPPGSMRDPSSTGALVSAASLASVVSSQDPRHVPVAQVLRLLQVITLAPCHHFVGGRHCPEKEKKRDQFFKKKQTRDIGGKE